MGSPGAIVTRNNGGRSRSALRVVITLIRALMVLVASSLSSKILLKKSALFQSLI
jgi:hypothetical protein